MTKPEEMDKMVKEMERRLKKAAKYHASAVGDYIIQIATEEIQEGRFETARGSAVTGVFNHGELMRSSGKKVTANKIIVGYGAPHSIDMEYGLTPGEFKRKTKFNDILQWVKDKGIGSGNQQYGIARKIFKNLLQSGISPRPFFRRAISKASMDQRKIVNKIKPKIENIIKYGKVTEPKDK